MRWLLANLLLALAWAALTAGFTLPNLLAGFALGSVVLLVVQRLSPGATYFGKVWRVLRFAGFYLWELVLANLRVASDVITPGYRMRPAVVAVPLDCRSEGEITLLAMLIAFLGTVAFARYVELGAPGRPAGGTAGSPGGGAPGSPGAHRERPGPPGVGARR